MSNSLVTTDIFVNNNKIGIMRVGNVDYISLTDIAKYKGNGSRPADIIRNWLRNRNTLEFISTWEEIYNNDFKVFESEHFRINAGLLTFTPSISEWINETNAIGFVVKSGKNGGTYAHPDIAFEFASILSPSFKLYLIQEFDMIHLIILSNLENINANLISKGISQRDRLIELNNIAINQLELFKNNKSIEELKQLENNMKGGD